MNAGITADPGNPGSPVAPGGPGSPWAEKVSSSYV